MNNGRMLPSLRVGGEVVWPAQLLAKHGAELYGPAILKAVLVDMIEKALHTAIQQVNLMQQLSLNGLGDGGGA